MNAAGPASKVFFPPVLGNIPPAPFSSFKGILNGVLASILLGPGVFDGACKMAFSLLKASMVKSVAVLDEYE
jgi:hypothetical protein